MTPPRDLGPRMQAAAQGLVDWYAATYGPRRAHRYLGTCERHGLSLPAIPPRPAARWTALAVVVIVLALAAGGGLLAASSTRVAPRVHAEVNHESR